jgi:hypothetical protein
LSLGQSFISLLDGRVRVAEQAVAREFLRFFLVWAFIYMVAKGFISEAVIGGAKTTQVQTLIIGGPVVLGYLSYSFSAALSSVMVVNDVISACYEKFIPKLAEEGIDLASLISSSAFVGGEEQVVLTQSSRVETTLSIIVLVGVVIFSWGLSLFAIGHVSYMLLRLAQWPRWVVAISALFGVVLWLRGASMIYHRTVLPASVAV